MLLTQGPQTLDSTQSSSGGVAAYVLKAPVLFEGEQVFNLYLLAGEGDTLQRYRLPLQVQEAKVYQLGLFTAFPEAESKYLKDFLTGQGYKVQYGAQLAPGKEIREWANLPQQPFQYTQKALAAWDALIFSSSYAVGLGRTQQQELQQIQQQAGVGLLLYPDGEQNAFQWQDSRIAFAPESVTDTLFHRGARIPLEYRPILQLPTGWEVVLRGQKGIAAIGRRNGLAKVVVTGGVNTYALQLKGAPAAYTHYWNTLLAEVLPLEEKKAQWEQPLGPALHWPVQLQVQSQDSLLHARVLGPDQAPLPLDFWQEVALPGGWQTRFWPRQEGWYTAQAPGDTLQFWVSASMPSIKEARLTDALRQLERGAPAEGVAVGNQDVRKPLPLWWFYVIFLTSMGALWLEKKLNA